MSIESASYIGKLMLEKDENNITEKMIMIENEEDFTPKLFSEENNMSEEINNENNEKIQNQMSFLIKI